MITQLLLSLLTLAAFAWAGWQGYLLLMQEQRVLDPGTQSLLVIAAIITLVCTYILASAIRRGAATRITAARVAVYEGFTSVWLAWKEEKDPVQKAGLELKLNEYKASMAILAGQQVLKAANQLLAQSPANAVAREAFENLLLAMRADLGQSNFYPLKNEIKKLFSPFNA